MNDDGYMEMQILFALFSVGAVVVWFIFIIEAFEKIKDSYNDKEKSFWLKSAILIWNVISLMAIIIIPLIVTFVIIFADDILT